MATENLTLSGLLGQARRHVVIIGAFSKPGETPESKVKNATAKEVLAGLECSLAARREHRSYDEGDGFWTHEISTWSRAKLTESGTGEATKEIPAHSAIMREYFGNPTKKAHEVGGHVLAELTEACEISTVFWHSHFARQLIEAVHAMRSAKNAGGAEETPIDDTELRILLNDVEVSQRVIEYLRASEDQKAITRGPTLEEAMRESIAAAFEDLGKQRPGAIAEEIAGDVQTLAQWLGASDREAALGPAHLRILDGEGQGDFETRARKFETVRRAYPIPGHESATLRQAYATFRDAHDRVERIAQCEPLMTFVTEWYLATFCADETVDDGEIAKAVFGEIYENNEAAEPNAIPADVREAATKEHDDRMLSVTAEHSNAVKAVNEALTRAAIERRSAPRDKRVKFGRTELDKILEDATSSAARRLLSGSEEVDRKIQQIAEKALEAQSALGRAYERAKQHASPRKVLIEEVKSAVQELCRALSEGADGPLPEPEPAIREDRTSEMLMRTVENDHDGTEEENAEELCKALCVNIARTEGEGKRRCIDEFLDREGKHIDAAQTQLLEGHREAVRNVQTRSVAGAMPAPDAEPARVLGAIEAPSKRILSSLLATPRGEVVLEAVTPQAREAVESGVGALPERWKRALELKTEPVSPPDPHRGRAQIETQETQLIGDAAQDADSRTESEPDKSEDARQDDEGEKDEQVRESTQTRTLLRMATRLSPEEREALAAQLAQAKPGENALVNVMGSELARRRAATRGHSKVLDEIITDARFTDRNSLGGAALRAAMLQMAFARHVTAVPERCPLDKPDTSFHVWLTLLVLPLASELTREFVSHPERGNQLASWRQTHDENGKKAIRQIPLWEMIKEQVERETAEEDEAFRKRFAEGTILRLSRFVSETKSQGDGRASISAFYEDVEELRTLLEALGEQCEITLINDTVERCNEEVLWRACMGRTKSESDRQYPAPPATVYITRQGTTKEPAWAREKIAQALGLLDDTGTGSRKGPLAKPASGKNTNIQSTRMKGLVSMPFIVTSAKTAPEDDIPSVEIPELPSALLIPILAGVVPESASHTIPPWNTGVGKEASRKLEMREIVAYPHTSHYEVMRQVLQKPETMRALLHSKAATAACAVLQLGPCTNKGTLGEAGNLKNQDPIVETRQARDNFEWTIRTALAELGSLYEITGVRHALGEAMRIRTGSGENATWQKLAEAKHAHRSVENAGGINIEEVTNEVLEKTLARILPRAGGP